MLDASVVPRGTCIRPHGFAEYCLCDGPPQHPKCAGRYVCHVGAPCRPCMIYHQEAWASGLWRPTNDAEGYQIASRASITGSEQLWLGSIGSTWNIAAG